MIMNAIVYKFDHLLFIMIKEKSCGIILFRDAGNKRLFLLLQYNGLHWDFPKGHVESNESEIDTAKRETLEETGITELDFIENFREQISYYYTMKGKKMFKDVYFFLAKTKSENVLLSPEHIRYIWLEYPEALNKLTYDGPKDILKKAQLFLSKK